MGGWVGLQKLITDFDMRNGHKGGLIGLARALVKQNKKAKICFVIHIAGEKKLLFYIYDVIVKQIFYKRPANHYFYLEIIIPYLYLYVV